MLPIQKVISDNIRIALEEDLGNGDITASLIPEDKQLQVRLLCREAAVLCGTAWFDEAFLQLDSSIKIEWSANDGDAISADQVLCKLGGNARALLSGERTALNFLQTLSATATVSRHYASLVQHTRCRILDTRKTIPGLRLAQKYAVSCGGGENHRIGLFDAFLLKENHLAAAGSISEAVKAARHEKNTALVEVEVENLEQLNEAIEAGADRVLLDNFSLPQMREAVSLTEGRLQLEASGNITDQTIVEIAETGIDFISIGALTKHVRAIDFSLRFTD